MEVKDKITLLPNTCGVYKFYDKNNSLLYVGKAVNLRNRVSSYFKSNLANRPRIIPMIKQIFDVKYIETSNEIEALVLESAIIRKEQPKYNADLKDDKSYAYLYINTQDSFPTVKIIRDFDIQKYKKGKLFGPYPSGRAIKAVFRYLRQIYPFCTSKDPTKPCFESKIGLCPGVVSKEVYRKNIKGILNFLNGKNLDLLRKLENQMIYESNMLNYEKAALLRDKIIDLKYLTSKINTNYLSSEKDYISIKNKSDYKLITLLGKELGIDTPLRIECYDISNLSGKYAYGSMTVASNGSLNTGDYRVFKIKCLNTPNDYEMLYEVLKRRLSHLNNDLTDNSLNSTPNIILIDGGKGQLSKLKDLIPKDILLLGITKGRKYKRKGGRLKDEFVRLIKDEIVPIKIKNFSILSRLRDEAHRFAILHHRKSRGKGQIKSYIDDIPNVGPKTKKLIKSKYSLEQLRTESRENLIKLIKNKKIVDSIINYFKTH